MLFYWFVGKPSLSTEKHSQSNESIDTLQLSRPPILARRMLNNKPTGEYKTTRDAVNRSGVKYTTIAQFLQLCDASPETIAVELLHDLKSFQKVILNSNRIGERRHDMLKILLILSKLTKVDEANQSIANRVLAETFNSRSCQFCFKLQQYVQAICSVEEFTRVIGLFYVILKLLPSSWEVLPVENLKEGVLNYAPSLCSDTTYSSMIAAYEDAKQNVTPENAVIKDYSEYRNLPILPTVLEINEFLPPKLHPSIVEGSYESWEHYYDIQFKLLREDFIAPLRRGVCGYREGLRGRDISDVRVYYNVTFTSMKFTADGIIISVKFDSSRLRRINWEHSKRLIYGSLLCFSYNNFESAIFASVAGREAKELKEEGLFTVKMESNIDILNLMLNTNDVYTMIESQAHYETYYHVLRTLQNAEVDTMPFTDVLIKSKCHEVQPPVYLCLTDSDIIDHPKRVFNMKDALGKSDCQDDDTGINDYYDILFDTDISEYLGDIPSFNMSLNSCNVNINDCDKDIYSFDINKPECWPGVEQVQLDQSQLDAMKTALTQRVSVIQGPPGTGKTYIGVKIVQALLTNRDIWDSAKNSPLLVVCYTNHALDQFLEEIIKLRTHKPSVLGQIHVQHRFSVIRVGSRCQNERISKFSIKNPQIRRARIRRDIHQGMKDAQEEVKFAGLILDYKLRVIQGKCEPEFSDLMEFMAPIHKTQLHKFVQDICEKDEHLSKYRQNANIYRYRYIQENYSGADDGNDEDKEKDGYYGTLAFEKGLLQWCEGVGCDEVNKQESAVTAENKNDSLVEDISNNTSRGSKPSNDEMSQTDELETNNDDGDGTSESDDEDNNSTVGDEDNDNTVDVVGEAKIAEAERMVDEPAAAFAYEEVADGHLIRPSPDADIERMESFTHDTVNKIDDISKLSKQDRLRLYDYWKQLYIEKLHNELHVDFEQYLTLCKEYQKATKEEDLCVLEKVDLIGMTTTGAAKYQHIIQKLKPKIIVVEEAAEVLESHIISCLTAATQQLILIGDHKQLRPNPNEYHLARDCNLDVSLFERLIRAGIPHATLEIQHRMRPEIAGLVCPHIYPKLLNHESVLQYEDIQGVTTNMYFFHHEYPEIESDELRSHSNEEEAKLIVGLCRYFLNQGYSPSMITVLTTYTSQLLKLKKLMPKSEFEGVRITAVDNFQGEENDIILLSLVRSNTKGRVGFLNVENRICVALSRAKKGFFCFGNFALLRESSGTWKSILYYLEEQGKLGSCLTLCCSNHPDTKTEIHTVDDFRKVPQGGCNRPCDVRLECGHVCKQYCHPIDLNHEEYVCQEPCAKRCDSGHQCPRLCRKKCPPCCAIVPKIMPKCGHIQDLPCHLEPENFNCEAPCTKTCEQGHPCSKFCSQDCGRCHTIVQKVLPKCGHIQDVYCYMDPALCNCEYPCERTCSTNPDKPHRCEKLCHVPCGDCKVLVLKTLPQCGHDQLVECYRNPIYHICEEPCKRKLDCGHPCTNKCGIYCTVKCEAKVGKILHCKHRIILPCSESIDSVECQMEVKKIFPDCKHPVVLPCSKPISKVYCQENVYKILPCDHGTYMKCSKRVEDIKCKTPIKVSLSCGHMYEGVCNKRNEKCSVLTVKQFPGCKHKIKLPCCEDLPPQCLEKCNVTLLCGHQCSGNCSDCHQGRMHKPCAFQMCTLPCGHITQEACTSITFPQCQYKCTYSCSHRKACTHNCSQPCNPCRERCSWKCPHYKCTRMCHEVCNRPRCDHPCRCTLQCKHPCIGICGEPCPRVCRICKKQKKAFHNLCVSTPSLKNEVRYIQLSCNHLFEVKELDRLLDNQFKGDTIVKPLECPGCGKEIRSSYRYGDLIRKKREMIRNIHDIMSEPVTVEQQEAVIEKALSYFLPNLVHTRNAREVELLLKSVTKNLPVVFKKPKQYLLAPSLKRIQAKILQNEMDQYMLLKEYESLYIQHPDVSSLLQELITFFIKAPPSVQKNHDVSCEKQRIFLLWMISTLIIDETLSYKHYDDMKQLREKLIVNNPKVTLPTLAADYDKLQSIARMYKLGKHFEVNAKHMQTGEATIVNGVWKVCTNGHVYCKPKHITVNEWECPSCPQ